ncbi:D-alanyl-D-alanine carboxypeptidase family protein [Oribacterium sp. HCP3S3_B9]|uniref:D-alanyl-D-alanine carboxypeptidase family protein n=1 Tax=Oribacterium sp. HCP3S3_B9 TaxID=3438946 RepID=UPI003F8BDDBA
MRHHFYRNRIVAGLLIAALSATSLSTTALADSSTFVEITDEGPLAASAAAGVQNRGAETATTTETAASVSSAGAQVVQGTDAMSTLTGLTGPTGTAVDTANQTTSTTADSAANQAAASAQQSSTAATNQTAQSSATAQAAASAQQSTQTIAAATQQTTNYFQQPSKGFLRTAMTLKPEVNANFAILVDADAGLVVAEKNGNAKMYPASMTKVMTLLVACEHITDLSEKLEITQDIVDYVKKEGASNCGFKAGEQVTMLDLLYGLILPSGADAALALVRRIAGSEEQFVALMNQKAQQLGISATTHFTNCTGLYNDNHYSTAEDMAIIMRAAAQNSVAATILTTRSYTTQANNKRTTGLSFSNLFLKRIDTQTTGGQVNFAKTGYVAKAGNCAASYFTAASGRHYICVTGKTSGAWNVVSAHAALYSQYAK